MQRQFDIFFGEAPDVLAVHWGWLVALGLALVAVGLIAIWKARTATLVYVGFPGAALLVGAVVALVFAFTLSGYWTDLFIHVPWAIILAVVNLILLTRPAGAASVALAWNPRAISQ